MQRHQGGIRLSASDLMRFMECRHATALDLARLEGRGPEPVADSADAALLQAKGDAHERAFLERLRAEGRQVVELTPTVDLEADAARTRAVLADGAEVVFQGALAGGAWGGWTDFLLRVETPSDLGPWSYEVTDTKLKRSPAPKHVLQLALYSELLAEVQGRRPEHMHVALGSGETASLRLSDHAAYAARARRRLEAFVAGPPQTRAVPVPACELCRWRAHCAGVWAAEDSLHLVAGIRRSQVAKLEAAGVTTMAALAAREDRVPRLAPETLETLSAQAAMQVAAREGRPAVALRQPRPGKGFDLLPAPDAGDLFYDIEGDPHVEGGLDYLHGLWAEDTGFTALWGHDRAQEGAALARLAELFADRLAAHPEAHVYHYGQYEIAALRRLTATHGVGEALLDRMLREGRFVDLLAVVRGGIVAGVPSYSLKEMEVFHGLDRGGEVTTAGGSVVAYERWRETGEAAILDEIAAYNRLDCISTARLRDWLVREVRPDRPWPARPAPAAERAEAETAEDVVLRTRLAYAGLPEARQRLLFDLARFHARESRPGAWAVFDAAAAETEALIEDPDCLGGLEADGPAEPAGKGARRSYRFPPQQTRLRAGDRPTAPLAVPPPSVTVEALDRSARRVTVRASARLGAMPDRLDLTPPWPVPTGVIAEGVARVVEDQCGPRRFRAVDDLLSRRAPRLDPTPGGALLPRGADPVAGTVAAVRALDAGVLPIQGPPGTGKTHVAARAILALVREGRRVAVSASSHEAIANLLTEGLQALGAADPDLALVDLEMAHKTGRGAPPYDPGDARIAQVDRYDDPALARAQIVGGTAWMFARPEFEQAFDTLVVDEAGQVSLASLVAMGRAARNIVLVGDPRQLPQVIRGAHPAPADRSGLDWLLGDHATVPEDRGIFLPETRRMHPALCRVVSERVYEGRLSPHPDTARQRVAGAAPFPEAGAALVPVAHEGNAQEAPEEVAAIARAVGHLEGRPWTGPDGRTRALTLADIVVVAPYNARVNALAAALPEAVRVGTVDRFQGREAPVCLVSMTASSAAEIPRGLDFLFSRERLNVALSRARALALVFGSPRLLDAPCATLEDMRLVNLLCALAEAGEIRWDPGTRPGGS